MNEENFSEVRKLIALKRHEQPDDSYFEEFMDEFHCRQRQELLKRSSFSLFCERLSAWCSGSNKRDILWLGGLVYAVILLTFMLWPKGIDLNSAEIPNTQIEHTQTTDPAGQTVGDMLTPDEKKQPLREVY